VRLVKALILCVLLLVSACGGDDEETRLPREVAERAELASCGRYQNRNEPPGDDQRAKNRCLLGAWEAGRQAELVVVQASVEGDPITTHFRVLGAGDLQLLVDPTQDRYGRQRWYEQRCTTLTETAGFLQPDSCGNEKPL
jgi:hypothetical protein